MKRILILLAIGLMAAAAFAQTPKDTYVEDEFGSIDTLDPAQSYDTSSSEVIQNVYQTLYFYKGASNADYVPQLATDYKVSQDGKTYTYTLRKGVTFHNGDPFTCADVAYSIKRAVITNNAQSGDWILAGPLTGQTANAKDALGKNATAADFQKYYNTLDSAVTCPDPYTAVFHLQQADPTFFSRMMFGAASIVDKKWAIANGQWDGTEATWQKWIGYDLHNGYLQDHMNGTGPYQMVQWVPGQKFVAKAYANYWGSQPAIQNVLINRDKEVSTRILNIQKGNADYIDLGSLADLKQLQGSPGVKIWNEKGDQGWSSAVVDAIFLNENITTANNPNVGSGKLDGNGIPSDFFSDRDARLCFNYSFDRQAYTQQVLLGMGRKLTMALPPSFLGYDPNVPTYSLDLEKAKQHCQAAWGGKLWQNGMKMTLLYNTGNTARQTAVEILKSNLEYMNPKFNITTRGVAWPDFIKQASQHTMVAYALGWAPDYADPVDYINVFYAKGGYYADEIGFSNPQINQLSEQAATETNPDIRKVIYSQIGNLAYQQAPIILLPQARAILVTRSDLKGVYYNSLVGSGQFLWKDISK